jgi:hypothetical protein
MIKKIMGIMGVIILLTFCLVSARTTTYIEQPNQTTCADQGCDGNWDTSSLRTFNAVTYMNYTKPSVSYGALLQVKTSDYYKSILIRNLSIPETCYNYDNNKIILENLIGNGGNGYWGCLGTIDSSQPFWYEIGMNFAGNTVYEDGVYFYTQPKIDNGYQEDADQILSMDNIPDNAFFDGDWNTMTGSEASEYSDFKMKYDKPVNVKTATWKVKNDLETTELPIPNTCFNFIDGITLRARWGTDNTAGYDCADDYTYIDVDGEQTPFPHWVVLKEYQTPVLHAFEEAMIWDKPIKPVIVNGYQEDADSTTCRSVLCDGNWNVDQGALYPITENMNYTIPQGMVGATWRLGIGGSTNDYVIPDVCFAGRQKLVLSITSSENYYQFNCQDNNGNPVYVNRAYSLNWIREEGVNWQKTRNMTGWDFTPNTILLAGLNSNDNYGNPSIVSNVQFTQIGSDTGVANLNSNSLITVPVKSWFNYTNGVTITTRFYSTKTTQQYLVFKDKVFLFQVDASHHLQAGIYINSVWTPLVTSSASILVNKWYDAKFTYDNKDAKLYLNGVLVAKNLGVSKKLSANNNPIFFGNRPDLTRGFAGYIDKIAITNG